MASTEHLSLVANTYHAELACRAEVSRDRTSLSVRATLRNLFGGRVFVFLEDPPLVRLLRGHVELSSAMPIIPRWVLPYTPHVPPVVPLEHDRAMDISAAYVLPLRETHPYPAEPIARAPVSHADEVASRISLTIGFFPEIDENELHARSDGKQIPSYYQLRRQFLVTSSVTGLSIPVTRPLWSGA